MEELVSSYLSGESDAKNAAAREIAASISSGTCTVEKLVELMREDLTSDQVDKRLKPLELIASTLANLHESCLSPAECSVLVEFLRCRLQDHFALHPPTLAALAVLSGRSHLLAGTAESVLKTIFKEVHVPSYMQSDRRAVFDILLNLLDNYPDEVRKCSDEFVCGVITVVDGEQDPRNLVKVFDLMCCVVRHGLDLGKVVEEFFEVAGCYFPIDFEPPTNLSKDRIVVTNEQLVTGLRKVLTSSPLFAPYCIPLMIEKIESDVNSAKIDALTTLSQCLAIYSLSSIAPYLRPLWLCLKKEIMGAKTKDVEELAQSVLRDLILLLSKLPQPASQDSALDLFVKDIVEECVPLITQHLQEKMAWSAGSILLSAAEASRRSCEKILPAMLPVLLKSLDRKGLMIAEKRLAMELIVRACKAASGYDFHAVLNSHLLLEYKSDVLELFCNCVVSQEFVHLRTVALAGVAALCDLGLLITPEDQLTIVHSLIYCFQHEKDETILKDLRIACGFLSSKWPDVALARILPAIKQQVSNLAECSAKDQENCLKLLCSISTRVEVTSVTCNLLMAQVVSKTISEDNAGTILECLNSILIIVRGNVGEPDTLDCITDALVRPLVKTCVELSLTSILPEECCASCSGLQTFSSQCVTWPIMQKVSEILRAICQNLKPGERADSICDTVAAVLLNSDLRCLTVTADKATFNLFRNTRLPLQTRLVTLLTATFCAFDNEVRVPQFCETVENLLNLCQQTTDQPSYASSAKCLAGLLNKNPETAYLERVLQLSACLFEDATSDERRIAMLSLVVWMMKALVLRSHPSVMRFSEVLFRLFADKKLGKMAADSFDIILRTSDEVLNESCHACIRLMHKQKFFQSVLPRLTAGFQEAEEHQKSAMEIDDAPIALDFLQTRANYLTALSHLLHHLPKQVLNQHLRSLLPLLIKSLRCEEGPLLVSVLSTLYGLAQESKSSLEPHVDMLLDRFMRLAMFEGSIHVRMQALKCVGVMTLLPVNVVLPHKKRIVRELCAALDDKKRIVRKEAVKARTEWCLLGDA